MYFIFRDGSANRLTANGQRNMRVELVMAVFVTPYSLVNGKGRPCTEFYCPIFRIGTVFQTVLG